MGRRKSRSVRTTLYRLVDVPQLADGVRAKYLERPTFSAHTMAVGDRDGFLVSGVVQPEEVPWVETLRHLTGHAVQVGNMTAMAVLLIRDGADGAWALTYGMGFQLLDQDRVDGGFGQRIAIRSAEPSELQSLTRTVLDHRSRTDRFSIPGGEHLRGFGVGDFGELVTRLVAKAKIGGLTAGDKLLTIRGADSLSVPLARTPEELLSDIDVIDSILDRPAPPDLEILEQLVAVKHQPGLIERLEATLAESLMSPSPQEDRALALSWPHERIDENGTPSSFKLVNAGRGRSGVQDGLPELSTIVDCLVGLTGGPALDRLARMKIMLFRDVDGDEPISSEIPARRWLAFQTEDGGNRYCLHDGSWYRLTSDYAGRLRRRVEAILARDPGFRLPDWRADESEAQYNKRAANDRDGVCLDKQLIRTVAHPRGIEVCDILLPEGVFVHVKHLDSSAPASHLLAQALVSTDALLDDGEARASLRERVVRAGGDPAGVNAQRPVVVLGIARRKPLTADNLFTFTQVNLVRQVSALEARGVDVFVAPILRA